MQSTWQHKPSSPAQTDNWSAARKGMYLADHRELNVPAQLKTKVNVNDSPSLDVMGAKAAQLHSIPSGNVQRYARTPVSGKVVQRYYDLGHGNLFGYAKGTGTDTPQFEFQKTEARRTEDANTSEATYDVHSSQFFENAPNIRVANSYNMAVPSSKGAEAKHFFATSGVIAASNAALLAANAPLRLLTGTGKITLPTLLNPQGVTLHQVSPDLSNVVLNGSECGTFAHDILGVDVHRIELSVGGGPAPANLRPASAAREIDLNQALNGQQPEQVGANSNADPDVGDAFGILSRRAAPAAAAVNGLWNNIVTLRGMLNETVPHMKWGEHWAGVVAKSGGDYVTLENYNRAAAGTDLVLERLEKDYKAVVANGDVRAYAAATAKYLTVPNEGRLARIARLGSEYMKYGVRIGGFTGYYHNQLNSMWYFAMYGSAQQSFHNTWKKAATNAVTVKIPH